LFLYILCVKDNDKYSPCVTGCEIFCDQGLKTCLLNSILKEISLVYAEKGELLLNKGFECGLLSRLQQNTNIPRMYVFMYVYMCIWMCFCVYICMYVCACMMHACSMMYVHAYVHENIHISYIHTYIYTYLYTYIHTHTHTIFCRSRSLPEW
jgi:hypothetical protein